MRSKLLDLFLYGTATLIIVGIIATATRAERQYDEEVELFEELHLEDPLIEDKPDITSEIIYTSRSNCSACDAFRDQCIRKLRDKGWRVTRKDPDNRPTPSFDVRLGGRIVDSKTGYRNRGAFFDWLRDVIRRNP